MHIICMGCEGTGAVIRVMRLTVTVPSGTKNGALLRLVGVVDGASPQHPANDLYVEVLFDAG